MLSAVFWGVVAASSFVLGGVIALRKPPPREWIALGAGFGAGALLGAVAYELIDEADRQAGRHLTVAIGLLAGVFVASAVMVGKGGLRRALASRSQAPPVIQRRFASLLLSVAAEVVVIVGAVHVHHGVSIAVVVAVFLCGVPEAMVATAHLVEDGVSHARVMETWTGITAYGGVIAVVAYLVIANGGPNLVAIVLSAAGGLVLATIAAHLIPTSYAGLGVLCSFPVVAGFALSVSLVGAA